MTKSDWLGVGVLWLLALLIFHPLFYTDYLYTDEAVQLWLYRPGAPFQMFTTQGRALTEKLFQWLFSKAHTISDVKYIRSFSLGGWMVCIPVWYYVIKQIVVKEGLPKVLPFISVLYLICMPPFTVYVSWASCLELFIANTAGLLSGYFLYNGLQGQNNHMQRRTAWIMASVLAGVLSLFTYQNGFGCFLLPFVLSFIAQPKWTRVFFSAIGFYFFIYLVYYVLFKYSLAANGIAASQRTSLYIAPWGKLAFVFTRPLNSAFHFTAVFNEKSIAGFLLYGALFLGWISAAFYRFRTLGAHVLHYVSTALFLFVISYLPSLAVRENYASNRTLLAINLTVFFFVVEMLFYVFNQQKQQRIVVRILSLLFFGNALYNFHQLFLKPITAEYNQTRAFIEKHATPSIFSVYFIRPPEDFFIQKYGITRSWDELGVPSTFFQWVPEYFVKQVVFEKTGDRALAEKLLVKSWLGKEAYLKEAPLASDSVLTVDAPELLK